MKYIFLSLLFLSCAHQSPVQYNDPETTRVEAERRALLEGKWIGKSGLLELTRGGNYLEKDHQGNVTGEGVWGVSREIYFVLNKKKSSLYQNFQIIQLHQTEFIFKDPKTAEIFHFKRLLEL